jgi:hypothetical protein
MKTVRIYVAMDSDGDIRVDSDVDELHNTIAECGSLRGDYRVVAIDLSMTPPKAVDDDEPADVAVTAPDDAPASVSASVAE